MGTRAEKISKRINSENAQLFIADLAFDDALINAAKLGILSASVASAAGGLAVLAWATGGKPASPG